MNWKVKKVKLSDIKEYEANPRKISEKGLSDLKKSIKNFGQAEPLVVDKDLTLIGRHARKLAMESLGYETCEVYISEKKLTDKQFQELNIRLNRNVAGTFDFEKLSDFFETDDLLNWGFEDFELETDLKEPDIDPERVAEAYDTYLNNNIRQIVLYFEGEEYETVLKALDKVAEDNELEDNSEAVKFLLKI